MSYGLRISALALGFGCLVVVGCSTGARRSLLPDGSYEVTCEGSLSKCLLQMETVCKDHGYDVIRATEKRERNGPLELQTEIVRSEGIVRCRKADALLTTNPPPPPPVPTEAPPPLPEHPPLPPLHAPPSSATPSSAPAPASPGSAPVAEPPVPPSAPSAEPAP